jgi:hypothetical protein
MSDIIFKNKATPTTPSTGKVKVFSDTATKQLASINDAGVVSYYANLAVSTIFVAFYVENGATTMQFVGKSASGTTVDNAIGLFGNLTTVYGSATYMT